MVKKIELLDHIIFLLDIYYLFMVFITSPCEKCSLLRNGCTQVCNSHIMK